MNRFCKLDDLFWRADEIHEPDYAHDLAEELSQRYPTAEVQCEKSVIHDKAYPVYFWLVDIFFKDEADEAEFILKESK